MMMRSFFRWMAAGLLLAISSFSHAQTAVEPIEAIQGAAEKQVRSLLPAGKAKYYVTAQRMDPRLRLAACTAKLEAFVANNAAVSARSTVGVRCPSQNTWTVYVPVIVEVEAPILVLLRPLARRAAVEQVDVELQTRRLPGIASAFISDVGSLPGRRLKRALPAGSVLTADVLVPDVLVRRGQQVTLIAMSGTIEIRAQGQAISEGGANERIRVQNISSMKIVEGVVESDGTVRIPL